MSMQDWINALFKSIDAKDTSGFLSYLTEDGVFRFGNMPGVVGHAAIRGAVDGFFGTIAASKHDLFNVWSVQDHVICQGQVTYTRKDGSTLTLPFVNVFAMRGALIQRYEIYIDVTPLYA